MKIILSAFLSACLIYAAYGTMFAAEPVYRNYSVTVARGDTLWDIACRYTESREDVRQVISRITAANALKSRSIHPGQVLQIPLRVQDNGLLAVNK